MTVKANSIIISGLQDIASWGLTSSTVATSAGCLVTVTPNGHCGVSENFLNGDLPTRARVCAPVKIDAGMVREILRGEERGCATLGERTFIYSLGTGDFQNLFCFSAALLKLGAQIRLSENFPKALNSKFLVISILVPPCTGTTARVFAGLRRPALNLFLEEMP